MKKRYEVVTLDYGYTTESLEGAVLSGCSCQCVYPFVVIDRKNSTYSTYFFSHRTGRFSYQEDKPVLYEDALKTYHRAEQPLFNPEDFSKIKSMRGSIADDLFDM